MPGSRGEEPRISGAIITRQYRRTIEENLCRAVPATHTHDGGLVWFERGMFTKREAGLRVRKTHEG